MNTLKNYYRFIIQDKRTGKTIHSFDKDFTTVEQANWGSFIFLELGDFPNRLFLETKVLYIIEEVLKDFKVDPEEWDFANDEIYKEVEGNIYYKAEVRDKSNNLLYGGNRRFRSKEFAYRHDCSLYENEGLINEKDFDVIITLITEEMKFIFNYAEQVQHFEKKKASKEETQYTGLTQKEAESANSKRNSAQIAILVGVVAVLTAIFDSNIPLYFSISVAVVCFFIVLNAHQNPS